MSNFKSLSAKIVERNETTKEKEKNLQLLSDLAQSSAVGGAASRRTVTHSVPPHSHARRAAVPPTAANLLKERTRKTNANYEVENARTNRLCVYPQRHKERKATAELEIIQKKLGYIC